jgi:hypothetical protein
MYWTLELPIAFAWSVPFICFTVIALVVLHKTGSLSEMEHLSNPLRALRKRATTPAPPIPPPSNVADLFALLDPAELQELLQTSRALIARRAFSNREDAPDLRPLSNSEVA